MNQELRNEKERVKYHTDPAYREKRLKKWCAKEKEKYRKIKSLWEQMTPKEQLERMWSYAKKLLKEE